MCNGINSEEALLPSQYTLSPSFCGSSKVATHKGNPPYHSLRTSPSHSLASPSFLVTFVARSHTTELRNPKGRSPLLVAAFFTLPLLQYVTQLQVHFLTVIRWFLSRHCLLLDGRNMTNTTAAAMPITIKPTNRHRKLSLLPPRGTQHHLLLLLVPATPNPAVTQSRPLILDSFDAFSAMHPLMPTAINIAASVNT